MKRISNRNTQSVPILDKDVDIEVFRTQEAAADATRIGTVCYLPNQQAVDITRVALQSVQKFTPEPHELWVVVNASPKRFVERLKELPGVNCIVNNDRRGDFKNLLKNGSYANAIGLELIAQVIDGRSNSLFVMHNDVLALRYGWLDFLKTKLSETVRGASVVHDPIRVKAMHVSGMLFDFQLFKGLGMTFMPNLPTYDVGDDITRRFRENNIDYYVCRNTFNSPELVELIPPDNPIRYLHADRAFDEQDNVFFMHLGRGTLKAAGKYSREGKTSPEEWVKFANKLLAGGESIE